MIVDDFFEHDFLMFIHQIEAMGYGGGGDMFPVMVLFMKLFAEFPHLTTVLLLIGFICLVLSIGVIVWTIAGLLTAQLGLFVSKRRHLFWLNPLIFLLLCIVLLSMSPGFLINVQDNPFPNWARPAFYWTFNICFSLSGVAGGLLAPAIVVPLHALLRRLFRTVDSEEGQKTEEWAHVPAATSVKNGFMEGLLAPWNGFRYMCKHASLFWYAIIPFLLNLVITVFLLILLVPRGMKLFSSLRNSWESGWGWFVTNLIIGIFVTTIVLGIVVISWVLVQGILCDHFYAKIAEKVERQLGLPESEIEEVSFGYQIYDGVMDSGWLFLVNTACFLVQIIPGIGTVLGVCGGLYNNCMTLGGDQLSQTRSEKVSCTQ